MEALYARLKRMTAYTNVPKEITRENVNVKMYLDIEGGMRGPGLTLLYMAAVWLKDVEATTHLLSLGARASALDIYTTTSPELIVPLLESCADYSFLSEPPFSLLTHCYLDQFKIMTDYGAEPPVGCDWTNSTRQKHYFYQVQRRVARCRSALVALVAYCRRSEYTALRAVYKELAKWMWRMRGGGERCGPRGEKWNLE